jgi:hypothetical protein
MHEEVPVNCRKISQIFLQQVSRPLGGAGDANG